MASQHVRRVRAFLEQSAVHTVVAADKDVDWDIVFGSAESSGDKLPAGIPQRELLFLDEIISVSILLSCPLINGETFKSYLRSLDISLQTYAIGRAKGHSEDHDPDTAPPREPVDSQKVQDVEDPLVIVREAGTDSGEHIEPQVFAIWKLNVYLNRSRIRTVNPSIFFSASIGVRALDSAAEDELDDDYLPSGVADSVNVLEAFRTIPEFKANPPRLSAARLTKISPAGIGGGELIQQLRNTDQHLIRVAPAVDSRVRFAQLGHSNSQAKVLASLDVTLRHPDCEAVLEFLEFSLADGRAELLTRMPSLSLPLTLRARDSVSMIYDLFPNTRHVAGISAALGTTAPSVPYTANFSLRATLTLGNGTRLPLKSNWRTSVDLSHLSKPKMPSLLYDQPSTTSDNTIQTHLVTLTISKSSPLPPQQPAVGTTISWSLLVTNRSRTRRLRLALIPITQSAPAPAAPDPALATLAAGSLTKPMLQLPSGEQGRTQHFRQHRHKPTLSASTFAPSSQRRASSSSALSAASGDGRSRSPSPSQGRRRASRGLRSPQASSSTTNAGRPGVVTADSARFNTTTANGDNGLDPASKTTAALTKQSPGLIPLTADLRIGPLAPGACATAEMRFLVARAGLVGLEALRVVDLERLPPSASAQKAAAAADAATMGNHVIGLPPATADESSELAKRWSTRTTKSDDRKKEPEAARRKVEWVDVPANLLPDVVAVGGEVQVPTVAVTTDEYASAEEGSNSTASD